MRAKLFAPVFNYTEQICRPLCMIDFPSLQTHTKNNNIYVINIGYK